MEIPIPGISIISNKSLDRSVYEASNPLVPANEHDISVATKDVVLDAQLGIWVRVFLPKDSNLEKLPIILYIHGGGFIFLSAGSPLYDGICRSMSSRLQVIVISLNYRLAPENRLPAAFDDAITCFTWLQSHVNSPASSEFSPEPWLIERADFSNCILMGESAGAAIAHQLCARLPEINAGNVVNVKGLVSSVPGFIGSQTTSSEQKFATRDPSLSLDFARTCYKLALPEEATLDHPFGDPRGLEVSSFPPVLLVLGDEDLLIDRQLKFAEYLEESGVKVKRVVYGGRTHCDVRFPKAPGDVESNCLLMQNFITGNI